MPSEAVSPRAKRVWQRLGEWYGARFLEQHGTVPPQDWRRAIDATDNNSVKRALSFVQARYLEHPPTFPQFAAALRPTEGYRRHTGQPSVQEQLCQYAAKTLWPRVHAGAIPLRVMTQPWRYLYRENECVCVEIPAVEDYPGARIMAADMAVEQA